MTIRVLTADDHPIVRRGIKSLLATQAEMCVVAEASNGIQAVALYAEHVPDVVLMDLRMPQLDGVGAIRAIRATDPAARILALTTYDGDADINRALDAGACGYLMKDMLDKEMLDAVRDASAGKRIIPSSVATRLAEFAPRVDLTTREIEVLRLAGKGLSNREIARVIGRTDETVKAHLKHLMAKLDVGDRTEAITLAFQRGIIHVDD